MVANSVQDVDWAKARDSGKINKDKWKALVKDAKPHSKKIIAFFSPKPACSTSTAKTELVFDNYTAPAGPLDASPATSHSRKTSVDDVADDSSHADLLQELTELRQQLQSMKKQVVVVMDQSRKSSDRARAALQQAQEALKLKEDAAAEAPCASQHEDYMLDLMTSAGQDMSDQRVNARIRILLQLSQQSGSDFWADITRTRRIVQFQDRASQVRDFLDSCTNILAMVYKSMFPRNPQPAGLPQLMDKFKSVDQIHLFVKAQLVAGARFALIVLKIYYPKMSLNNIVDICHAKVRERKRNVDKINDKVTPTAEKMIEDLLRMDADFFREHHYADTLDVPAGAERINIDDLI
ncbi:hypothetical protein QYE76_015899 [Lolium multiflorum]|uniref:Uncharacterized protein n=1 Tax=Lolium multiflorum TaxID=4521 RepID=A0AAD8U5P3_LOLMU|nr:hypothetical protein QYE76_015899 [Lolium multiflorum]